MSRFTLTQLFSRWMPASRAPYRKGSYRVRTEPLGGAWFNGTATYDGEGWWEYGQHGSMRVRREVKVLQWQGLSLSPKDAIALLSANPPKSSRAKRDHARVLALLTAS